MRRSASTPSKLTERTRFDQTGWGRSREKHGAALLNKINTSRVIIVAEFLPANITCSPSGKWTVRWDDESSLFYFAHAAVTHKAKFFFVGQLRNIIPPGAQLAVERVLIQYRCIPVFLPTKTALQHRYYCDTVFRPLFGNFVDVFSDRPTGWWNRGPFMTAWQQYKNLNKIYGHKLRQFCENSIIWIHGYELFLVPTFLTMHASQSKTPIAFFLPSPFPSSEVFRTLSTCKTVLWGLLSVDQICFAMYEYTRHFLACCSRILDINTTIVKKGYIQLMLSGRSVNLLCVHPGIEPLIVQKSLVDYKPKPEGTDKIVILAVDNAKAHSGIAMKMLAFSHFLTNNPDWCQRVVLKQYLVGKLNSVNSLIGREGQAIQDAADLLNAKHMHTDGSLAVEYTVLDTMDLAARLRTYTEASILLATPIREGFNPVPLEFAVATRICKMNGYILVSEFSSCSCVFSEVRIVNPYDPIGVSHSIEDALAMTPSQRLQACVANDTAVRRNTTFGWTQTVLKQLQQSYCKQQTVSQLVRFGYGDTSHVASTSLKKKLDYSDRVADAWLNSTNRVLCFDFRGTIVDYSAEDTATRYLLYGHHRVPFPSKELLRDLQHLSSLPNTTVAIVSGLSRRPVEQAFGSITNLWLFAETGYYVRRGGSDKWETTSPMHLNKKMYELVEPAMEFFCQRTIGSYIQKKECTIVLEYPDADVEYGRLQAKNIENALQEALQNEPQIGVFSGHCYVLARPVGFSKASSLKSIIDLRQTPKNPVDFCLCVGDDTSDELMFSTLNEQDQIKEKFSCTVGTKHSSVAEYSVESPQEVRALMHRLQSVTPCILAPWSATVSSPSGKSTTSSAIVGADEGDGGLDMFVDDVDIDDEGNKFDTPWII